MTRDTTTLSELSLERYHLHELPADETTRLSARAAIDPALRARLVAITQSDADWHRDYPPDVLARAVMERAAHRRDRYRPSRPSPWRVAAAAAIVLAAAVAVPWVRSRSTPASSVTTATPPPADDRVKGAPAALVLYKKVGSSSEQVSEGDAARPGDLIRVAYRTSGPVFGVIISIDGRGIVTRHLPATGDSAPPLQPGTLTPLELAYELDDAPRWERFFLITSGAAFEVRRVLEAARAAVANPGAEAPAMLNLPHDLDQSSFLLRKVS